MEALSQGERGLERKGSRSEEGIASGRQDGADNRFPGWPIYVNAIIRRKYFASL